MKLDVVMKNYLMEIKLRHSLGTWRFYKSHLGHFLNYANDRGIHKLESIDENVIKEYITSMKETNENITINKNIGCLKRMYRFINYDFPFLQNIEKFKERHKTFDMLSEIDLKKIRNHVKSFPDSVGNNLYYKALILLLMDTGGRVQEVLMIEKKCVDLINREILLTHTKTKEDRLVYISEFTANVLKRLLMINTKHPYVLHNIIRNRAGTYDDVIFIMRSLRLQFGLKKLHAHMFRHSLATIMLQRGTDLRSVMEVLGHRNLETTQRYLHMGKEHTKKMYRKHYNLD